jgi:hypothetical protein
MKKFIIAVLLLASAGFALPDLQVLDLQYTNSRLVANIFNQAPDGVNQSIKVSFYDNGREIGSRLYTDALPRYSIFSVYMEYIPEKGVHDFKAAVDPENSVAERSDTNNEKSISYEQKTDTVPRNVSASEGEKPPAAIPDKIDMRPPENNITAIAVALAAVFIILLAIRLMQVRGKFRLNEKVDGSLKKELKEELAPPPRKGISGTKGISSVKSALRLASGSIVRIKARLVFNGKVGDEYTYFIRDGSGETVGVSDKKYDEKEYEIECAVESFMKDDKVLRIRHVK